MTTIPHRLTIITLGAEDFAAQRDFYLGLGFEPSVSMDTFCTFVLGGAALALFPVEDLAAEAGAADEPMPGPWRGVALAMNVDARDEVDAVWQAWVAAGATPVEEPEDRSWGGRSGYVADPEGNRWEIAWASFAVFTEAGALASFG